MSISMIGLDTAKSVFHVHAVDEAGKLEMKRKLQRNDLISFFEKQEAWVSRPRELHPWPLAEPGVKLSPHPAPIRQVRRYCQVANVRRVFCSHARSSQGRGARVPDAGGSACISASTKRPVFG